VCGKPGSEARITDAHAQGACSCGWHADPADSSGRARGVFDDALVLIGQVVWRCNWKSRSKLEWIPRQLRAPQRLVVARSGFIARGAQGEAPDLRRQRLRRRRGGKHYLRKSPKYDVYPTDAVARPTIAATGPGCSALAERAGVTSRRPDRAWAGGHRLPGMFRTEFLPGISTPACACRSKEPDPRLVLPLPAAKEVSGSGSASFTGRCTGGSSSTTSRAGRAVMLDQRYDALEALGHRRRGHPVAAPVVTKHFGGRERLTNTNPRPAPSRCRSAAFRSLSCRNRREVLGHHQAPPLDDLGVGARELLRRVVALISITRSSWREKLYSMIHRCTARKGSAARAAGAFPWPQAVVVQTRSGFFDRHAHAVVEIQENRCETCGSRCPPPTARVRGAGM